MKELRDVDGRGTLSSSGVLLTADKLMAERTALGHLVTSHGMSSPQFAGLSLLSPTALFGGDPPNIFSAHHLLAAASLAAASNPAARFQLPIGLPLGVPGSALYHHGSSPGAVTPVAALPTAGLDILSWVNEQKAKTAEEAPAPVKANSKSKREASWTHKGKKSGGLKHKARLVDETQILDPSRTAIKEVMLDKIVKETKARKGKERRSSGEVSPSSGELTNIPNNNNNSNCSNGSNGSVSGGTPGGPRDKVFLCPICQRSFGYKHVLQNHERTHTGEKPFECNICQKKFTRDHHLKTHMRLHTGEKPYQCSHCDRQFVQVANLRRHLRVHTGERPYACDLCSSRFSDSNQLKAHMLIHKGEKPYSCSECAGRFRRRHHLVHHKCSKDAGSIKALSPQDLSPQTGLKRERKSRETRRILRVSPASPPMGYISVVGPEQTHPEDLSMGREGSRPRRPFSGSGSSSVSGSSPSPPGRVGGPFHSMTSSEFWSSDEERGDVLNQSRSGRMKHESAEESSPSLG